MTYVVDLPDIQLTQADVDALQNGLDNEAAVDTPDLLLSQPSVLDLKAALIAGETCDTEDLLLDDLQVISLADEVTVGSIYTASAVHFDGSAFLGTESLTSTDNTKFS